MSLQVFFSPREFVVMLLMPVFLGLWRHPRNQTHRYKDVTFWTSLAKTLEDGRFHGLFIADMLGIYDVYKGPGNIEPVLAGAAQFPISDPLSVAILNNTRNAKLIMQSFDCCHGSRDKIIVIWNYGINHL